MAFWTDGGTDVDPKRNFRFRVEINGFVSNTNAASTETESLVWWAKKVQKPNFSVAEVKHVFLGHTFYYPGKTEWQEITMTLVDPVTPNAMAILSKIHEDSGYQLPKADGDLVTQSKSKSNSALGSVVIKQIDAEGNAVETWTLKNPFLKKVSFSDLDYENDDLTTVDLSFRYDWATCDTGPANLNTSATPFFDANGPVEG